jgi:3-oxoacyl-[acyl-carrier protein] reductase
MNWPFNPFNLSLTGKTKAYTFWAIHIFSGGVMKKVALVTGASRGIGRGIALELARLGWDLALTYKENELAALDTQLSCSIAGKESADGCRAQIFKMDVGEGGDRMDLLAALRHEYGRLDLLVNNAGIAPKTRTDILEATEESFDELMRINVKGPYFLTQGVARWMVKGKEEFGKGYNPKIITISSISAYTASASRGEYCVSKAALSMLTPLFAARLADYGINVYEIRPGIIATDMTAPVQERYNQLISQGLTPIRRWGQPEDVARAVSAIAQDLLAFSTGEIINVDGGFHLRRL